MIWLSLHQKVSVVISIFFVEFGLLRIVLCGRSRKQCTPNLIVSPQTHSLQREKKESLMGGKSRLQYYSVLRIKSLQLRLVCPSNSLILAASSTGAQEGLFSCFMFADSIHQGGWYHLTHFFLTHLGNHHQCSISASGIKSWIKDILLGKRGNSM